MNLPDEYRFDVARAQRELSALAESDPQVVIALTIAQLGNDGLEAESEIRLPAESAAALLATVTDDQQLQAGNRELVVLRVTRPTDPPKPLADPDHW